MYETDQISNIMTAEARGETRGEAIGEARGIIMGEARGEARGIIMGEARGITLGEARGITLGEARGKLAIAHAMKLRKMPIDIIAELTGLTVDEIENA